VFNINPDGTLTPVNGSPFPSGGSDPVSVGLADDTLVVVNKDQDPAQNSSLQPPNYTAFNVAPDGNLVPVPQSTVSVAYGSSPSQALIGSQGNVVFGADFLGGLLQSFSLDPNGALDQNLPQSLPASIFVGQTGGHQPLGMRTHPFFPILYVDITPISQVAVYTYDQQGRLSFVRTVQDTGAAPCWAVVNHAGNRLYVTNTGDNSVTVYDLSNPLDPAEIQHFVMANTTGAVFSTVIDRSERLALRFQRALDGYGRRRRQRVPHAESGCRRYVDGAFCANRAADQRRRHGPRAGHHGVLETVRHSLIPLKATCCGGV
jgi:6-phosphogluconolactonase (cycloisomerase 2 family)